MAYRPEPRPRSKSKQKKYVRGSSGDHSLLASLSPKKKRAASYSQGDSSETPIKLPVNVDYSSHDTEAHYPSNTFDRILFHRQRKRALGHIENQTLLDHSRNARVDKNFENIKTSHLKVGEPVMMDPSYAIHESTISQRELNSMSIAESLLTFEVNKSVLEVVLECLLPSKNDPLIDSKVEESPSQLSANEGDDEIEQGYQHTASGGQKMFNFACVPSTIQSLQQDLHQKIKKELSDITKPEPSKPSKLTDNISQKVKLIEERAKETSRRLRQLTDQSPSSHHMGSTLEGDKTAEVALENNTNIVADSKETGSSLDNSRLEREDIVEECSKVDRPERSLKKQTVVIEDSLIEEDENQLMSWQKEVVLPVTYGVSLGMVLDILEQNVVIVGFREVSPGVKGAAEASKRIDIGDMLLAINNYPLQSMEFEDIVDLVRGITQTPRHRQVVLLLGIAEYIHAEINKDRPLSYFLSQNKENAGVDTMDSEDPFAFLDGVSTADGPNPSTQIVTSSSSDDTVMFDNYASSDYCSFPGDLGLNIDGTELERRFQIMFRESRKLRKIRAEGIGYGFYDDAKNISPLFSLLSHKVYVASTAGGVVSSLASNEYEIKFKYEPEDSDDENQASSITTAMNNFAKKEEISVQVAGNGVYNPSGLVYSGGVDVSGVPTGLPTSVDYQVPPLNNVNSDWKLPLSYKRQLEEVKNGAFLRKDTSIGIEKEELISLKKKAIEPPSRQPVGNLVQEVVELDETLIELELQLQRYTTRRGEQVVIPDELDSLFIDLNKKKMCQKTNQEDESALQGGSISESEVGHVLQLILSTMASIDLSEKWCSPLDAWPPRRLTLTVASYIGFHIRDAISKDSFIAVESTLTLFLNLARSHWLTQTSPSSSPDHEASYDTGASLYAPPPAAPSLASMATLSDPKDVLHRNLICDLTTLYFQIRVVGWKKLSFLDPSLQSSHPSFKSRGYFWDLQVDFKTSLNETEVEADVKVGVLWSEERARDYINKHADFLRMNECISCVGARKWLSITAQLLDIATAKDFSQGRHIREGCHLVGKILSQYEQVEYDVQLERKGDDVELNSMLTSEKPRSGSEHVFSQSRLKPFYISKKDDNHTSHYELLPTSHDDSLQLLETLFSHLEPMEGYYALLLEIGQILFKFDQPFASRKFSKCFPHLTPWHVWTLLNSTYGPLSFTKHDVGVKVAVWRDTFSKYLPALIVGYTMSDGYGTHTIKFDKISATEELDMTQECFEVIGNEIGASFDQLETTVSVDELQNLRESCAFWYTKISYHCYLTCLISSDDCFSINNRIMNKSTASTMTNISLSNNHEMVLCEFIELGLLLASNLGAAITSSHLSKLKGLDTEEGDKDWLTRESLRTIRHSAYDEGLVKDDKKNDASNMENSNELLRYARAVGRSAREERLRNTIVYAKKLPFFAPFQTRTNPISGDDGDDDIGGDSGGGESSKESPETVANDLDIANGLDFEAWLFRVLLHSDYHFPKEREFVVSLLDSVGKSSSNCEVFCDWLDYLKQRWNEYADKTSFRYTDPSQCHVDMSKLRAVLEQFLVMFSEDDSSLKSFSSYHGSTDTNSSKGRSSVVMNYRSGWGKCKNMQDLEVARLQKTWNNVLHKSGLFPQPLFTAENCLASLDAVTQNNKTNMKLQLSIAMLYQRYGYWDGILNVCENLLNIEPHHYLNMSSPQNLGLWLYELVRCCLLGSCEVEVNSEFKDISTTRILKGFYLTSLIADRFSVAQSTTTGGGGGGGKDSSSDSRGLFESRIPHPKDKEHASWSMNTSDGLLLGLSIDAVNFYHAYHLEKVSLLSGIESLYQIIIKSLIEVLQVSRALAVVEHLSIFTSDFENISVGDIFLRQAFEFESQQQRLMKTAHEDLSHYHASLYTTIAFQKNKVSRNTSPFLTNMSHKETILVKGAYSIGGLAANSTIYDDGFEKGWGCVLGESDVCPLCSLPLTDSPLKSSLAHHNAKSQVSIFQCGHMFHSVCLQTDVCLICEVQCASDSLF